MRSNFYVGMLRRLLATFSRPRVSTETLNLSKSRLRPIKLNSVGRTKIGNFFSICQAVRVTGHYEHKYSHILSSIKDYEFTTLPKIILPNQEPKIN